MFASHTNTKSSAVAFSLCALFAGSANAVTTPSPTTVIDFDHDASGNLLNAPGFFNQAKSLNTLYAPLGVTFTGPAGSSTGGDILNGQLGYFPVPTHSGANFLCFQTGSTASGPETISFTTPATNVTIYASSPGAATFTMTAFSSAGLPVATSTGSVNAYRTAAGDYVFPYVKLSVNATALATISSVVLTEVPSNSFNIIYHYDDLVFTVGVPTSGLSGTLQLGGIASSAPAKPFTFELRPNDGTANITQIAIVGPDGAFSLAPVAQKDYTLHVKGDHYLATNFTLNAAAGDITNIAVRLNPGDMNGDNAVDPTDFGILVGAYNQTYDAYDPQAPASLVAADLNGDGSVDATDFGLFVSEYNKVGAK